MATPKAKAPVSVTATPPHPLTAVFEAVLAQVTDGDGQVHGDTPDFMQQRWARLAQLHGPGFLTGRAAQKLEAAVAMGADGPAHAVDPIYERELLDVIAYVAMAVLHHQVTAGA